MSDSRVSITVPAYSSYALSNSAMDSIDTDACMSFARRQHLCVLAAIAYVPMASTGNHGCSLPCRVA